LNEQRVAQVEARNAFGFTPSAWQGILAIIGLVVVLPLVEGLLEGIIEKKEKA